MTHTVTRSPLGASTVAGEGTFQAPPQAPKRASPVQKAVTAFMHLLRKSPSTTPQPEALRTIDLISTTGSSSAGDSLNSVEGR